MATSRINTCEVLVKVNLKKSSSLRSSSLKLKKSVAAYFNDKDCMENNVFQGFEDNPLLMNNAAKIRVKWGPRQSSFSNAKKRILIFKERGSGPVDVESSDDEDEEESPSASTMALPNSALDGLW